MNFKSIIGKGITQFIYMALVSVSVTSCGFDYLSYTNTDGGENHEVIEAGPLVDYTFDVSSDFTAITAQSFMNIVFVQSSNPADFGVKGLIPDNFIDKLDVKVKDGTLYISEKFGYYTLKFKRKPKEFPTIYVIGNTLNSVNISGSGKFRVNDDIHVTGGSFNVHITGSGEFNAGNFFAKDANVNLSVTGSGDIDLKTIVCNSLEGSIAGSGDIDVKTLECNKLDAGVAGSGDIKIGGKAEEVSLYVSGSGDIHALELKALYGKARVKGSGEITCSVRNLEHSTTGSGSIHNHP